MTDNSDDNAGHDRDRNEPTDEQGEMPKISVVTQFIRDLSFESPNVIKLLDGPGENPNLQLQINVNAKRIKPDLYESTIDLKAEATSDAGIIYDCEITYGGLFSISDIPTEALEPVLLVNCPALLFPFLRRLVADITREGGFPPLLLDPVDFAALYLERRSQGAENQVLN